MKKKFIFLILYFFLLLEQKSKCFDISEYNPIEIAKQIQEHELDVILPIAIFTSVALNKFNPKLGKAALGVTTWYVGNLTIRKAYESEILVEPSIPDVNKYFNKGLDWFKSRFSRRKSRLSEETIKKIKQRQQEQLLQEQQKLKHQ